MVGKQEFRVSHLDIRYIHIIDPNSRKIETLKAYNYRGDDRIQKFILKGLGEIHGFKGFPISLKMLNYAKNELERTQYDIGGGLLLMDSISQKFQENEKLVNKDLKFLDTVSKSQDGRGTMAQSIKNLQEQGGIEEIKDISSKSNLTSNKNTDDFKVTFPINKNPPKNIPLEIHSPFYDVTFPISSKKKKEPEHTPSEIQSSFYNITFPITKKNKKTKSSKEKNDKKKNNN